MDHKRLMTCLLSISILIAIGAMAQDNDTVTLHFFYGQGCPHCAKAISFLEELEDAYPSLDYHMHETYFDEEERELFMQMAERHGTSIEGVPTFFVGDKVIVGYSDSIGARVEREIERCINEGCADPAEGLEPDETPGEEPGETGKETENGSTNTSQPVTLPNGEEEIGKKNHGITVPAVVSAAFVDAINPCAFAVLIILLTTILATKQRRKALLSGLAFSLSIFISYFLMGIGLYSAIQVSGLSHTFYSVVAVLAILIGIFNLKDYLWYGKWFVMEVPMRWRPKLKALLKGVTSVPGAFLIGFAVSLFLLPCTSGPYIVILGLLSKMATRDYALLLLIIYNLIFILPMIAITLAVYFGLTTTEKAEEMRQKKLRVLHLIAGIIILSLGIGMLIALWLGMI